MFNFKVVACDTDSVFFKKEDESPFTEEEIEKYLAEVNSIQPEKIRWELNGEFSKLITLKAKNYIMWDGVKPKYKGSALKSSTLEPALKEFISEIINAILNDNTDYTSIYNKYVKEINDIKDIRRWSSKKTLSATTYKSDRANETKIINAIIGSEYSEGDRIYTYYLLNEDLALAENFKGEYNRKIYYGKLYCATERFSTIMNTKELFPNYALKRNQSKLEEVLNVVL